MNLQHIEAVECEHIADYSSVKPALEQVTADLIKERRHTQEKLESRKKLLNELLKHQEDNTFPTYIPSIRMPQVPASTKESFDKHFDAIMNRMRKEVLNQVIIARKEDINNLDTEINNLTEKITQAVRNILDKLFHRQIIDMEVGHLYLQRYINDVQTEQKDNICKHQIKEVVEEILKRRQVESEAITVETEPSEIELMKEQVKQLKQDLITVKKKQSNPKPQPSNPKKKPTEQGNKKDKKKPQPNKKPGKAQGAAGRGGKQNQPGKGRGKQGTTFNKHN